MAVMIENRHSLADYLARAAEHPFDMGRMDCARFVAGWVQDLRGVNPDGGLEYDARTVASVIRRHGGLRHLGARLADQAGLIEVESPRAGDVGVVELPNGKRVFAICADAHLGHFAVKTSGGLFIGPAEPLRFWSAQGQGACSAEAVGAMILTAIGVESFAIFGTVTLANVIGTVVVTALSIGAQYALATLMAPKGKEPAAQKQTVKSTIGARVLHYGRVKTGGTLVFSHARLGYWHTVLVLGVGPISGFVQHYVGNKPVTLPAAPGAVSGAYSNYYVRLDTRAGAVPNTMFSELGTAFPLDWTADHRLDGLAAVHMQLVNPGPKIFSQIFQGGIPNYTGVINGLPVYDPRAGTTAWSDNPALCIMDYLTRREGWGHALARIDLPSFSAFANLCDQTVTLKSGATEKRYRLSGSIAANEPRKDALRRMLDTCDGRIFMTPEGKIGIRGGQFSAPEFTIDRTMLVARHYELVQPDAIDRANILKPVYLSPEQDYQLMDAPEIRDEARIADEGEVLDTLDLKMVPSATQAQRLTKIAFYRKNAVPRVSLKCSMAALGSFAQSSVTLVDEVIGINAPIEVSRWSMELGEKVQISLEGAAVPAEAWAWDAATEEQDPAPVVNTITEAGIPVPSSVVYTIEPVMISATVSAARIRATFDAPDPATLTPELQWRVKDSAAAWSSATGDTGAGTLATDILDNNGTEYELQVRFLLSLPGAWSTLTYVAATTDAVPPAAVGTTSATGGAGKISASWQTPSSANFVATRVYKGNTSTFSASTLFSTRSAPPSASQALEVTGFTAGVRYVFLEPINGSGVAGPVTVLSATVT